MKDIDILRHEAEFSHRIWEESYESEKEKGNEFANLDHMHICDFELTNFQHCKTRKQLNKLVEKKCKEYLSSIGEERDKYMECCDYCIHARFVTVSTDNPDLILNIATYGVNDTDIFKCKGIDKLK